MSGEELKRALVREGAATSRDAWQRAEQVIEDRRRAIDRELTDLRKGAEQRLTADIAALRSSLLHAANIRARNNRLQTEEALGRRLEILARQCLQEIAEADRAALWQSLLAEIPAADWTLVRVHPADHERARNALPQAEVETDESLGGGMIVSTAGGRVQVDNSLSRRLERAWPELLPELLGELRTLVEEA